MDPDDMAPGLGEADEAPQTQAAADDSPAEAIGEQRPTHDDWVRQAN